MMRNNIKLPRDHSVAQIRWLLSERKYENIVVISARAKRLTNLQLMILYIFYWNGFVGHRAGIQQYILLFYKITPGYSKYFSDQYE